MDVTREYEEELRKLNMQVSAGRISPEQAEALAHISQVKYNLAVFKKYKEEGNRSKAYEFLNHADVANDAVRRQLSDKSLGLDKMVDVKNIIEICEQAVERAYESNKS